MHFLRCLFFFEARNSFRTIYHVIMLPVMLVCSVHYTFLLNVNAKVNSPWRSSLVLYSARHTHSWLSTFWSVVFTLVSNLCITHFKWMCILVPRPKQSFLLVCSTIYYTVDETNTIASWKSVLIQVCQRGVLFHVFLNLTTKSAHPHHIYSDLMPPEGSILTNIQWSCQQLWS